MEHGPPFRGLWTQRTFAECAQYIVDDPDALTLPERSAVRQETGFIMSQLDDYQKTMLDQQRQKAALQAMQAAYQSTPRVAPFMPPRPPGGPGPGGSPPMADPAPAANASKWFNTAWAANAEAPPQVPRVPVAEDGVGNFMRAQNEPPPDGDNIGAAAAGVMGGLGGAMAGVVHAIAGAAQAAANAVVPALGGVPPQIIGAAADAGALPAGIGAGMEMAVDMFGGAALAAGAPAIGAMAAAGAALGAGAYLASSSASAGELAPAPVSRSVDDLRETLASYPGAQADTWAAAQSSQGMPPDLLDGIMAGNGTMSEEQRAYYRDWLEDKPHVPHGFRPRDARQNGTSIRQSARDMAVDGNWSEDVWHAVEGNSWRGGPLSPNVPQPSDFPGHDMSQVGVGSSSSSGTPAPPNAALSMDGMGGDREAEAAFAEAARYGSWEDFYRNAGAGVVAGLGTAVAAIAGVGPGAQLVQMAATPLELAKMLFAIGGGRAGLPLAAAFGVAGGIMGVVQPVPPAAVPDAPPPTQPARRRRTLTAADRDTLQQATGILGSLPEPGRGRRHRSGNVYNRTGA